jgi:hypothetical protein
LHATIAKESEDFMTYELMPNKNLHENLKEFLNELEKILPVFSFKKISKHLTEKSLNSTKDKIKN